ncbi:hypothetical protein PYJP_11910 [Pyrofollis japonicus]|uniref:hypothetical protein n=1 Tax=Pyrofollis japonicus TaxID=3060460 RepID=UPI00295C113F|nr:hypothetical protein [Pyrofollis japonicus]BEP17839.1 hypothetical protein PYJP_11910 [Pyrofollis japonicus]
MPSPLEVREYLVRSMVGLYVVLNSYARRHYGVSFEELLVTEPDRAYEAMERVLGPRARVVAKTISNSLGIYFQVAPVETGGGFVGGPVMLITKFYA